MESGGRSSTKSKEKVIALVSSFSSDNSPNPSDPWGAYDDNTVIDTEDEKNLFVPKPYRPGSKDKSTTTTTTPAPVTSRPTLPPTTIRTIPFVQTTPAVRRPISVQSQFERPSTPSAPARFFPTAPPRQLPFQPKTIPQINPQLPAQPQPLRPRTRRPPVQPPTQPPFIPQQQQQQNFQRPFSPVQQPFQPIQQQRQPFIPQQPQFPPQQPQIPFSPQFQTVPPTTPAPQLPFAGQQNLRTGVCPMSIFYISTPISGPTRLSFTHFAIAVTVDQCARTCHEFNCAIAHYSPSNGHCEFNPSTAFAIRNGQCPAWPSLHYRCTTWKRRPTRNEPPTRCLPSASKCQAYGQQCFLSKSPNHPRLPRQATESDRAWRFSDVVRSAYWDRG
ncbi:unnamed protein product [Nippostrongylus brasiliensis]|uniref:Apple domain-containing protein n=1 Tax=Nippostrongylus brasiliensis TaxID=27835 RepID=A0A0N4YLG6_NIPBR|nr:unnamed protein product [Nippostrongylus brasiliensis]